MFNGQKLIELDNGIRVVLVPVPGLRSVTLEVFFRIGSKYEKKDEAGLSHFLEHMAFKGTKKRPSANDINSEIDSKGAGYNAGTSHEVTSYHITTVKENLPWAVEILSDILLNATYPENEVIKERGVISEEIRMYQDNPMMGLSGEFTEFMYGNSPVGCWNIAGRVEDVSSVDRNKLVAYKNKYLNPKETVIVVAGDVDASIDGYIRECFDDLEAVDTNLPEIEIILTKDKEKKIIKSEIEQGHFCMGLPTIPRKDSRKYALRLLDLVMCGNTSSRLYNLIREEKGWAYYVFGASESLEETGFWAVQSGVTMNKLDEAVELSKREISLMSSDLKESEMQRAKDYIVGKLKLAMDRSDFWSGFIGKRMLLDNELVSLEDELEKYNKVGFRELLSVAEILFVKSEIKLVTVSR